MIKWRVALWFFTKYDDSGALFLMPIVSVNTMNLVLCLIEPILTGYDKYGALLLVLQFC